MSLRNLDKLFKPRSIAIVGASTRPARIGTAVLTNALKSGFAGGIYPVSKNYEPEDRRHPKGYAKLDRLPETPDLAVLCTRAETVPKLIAELADMGTGAAIVVASGMGTGPGSAIQKALDAARPATLRILGPESLGVAVPGDHVVALASPLVPKAGNSGIVLEGAGIATAMLDWLEDRGIGFSHLVSLGLQADIDHGDVLDYLTTEQDCRSVIVLPERLPDARKFMSAARLLSAQRQVLASRLNPPDRPPPTDGPRTHVAELVDPDAVMAAAMQRAGMLEVTEVRGLFAAAAALPHAQHLRREKLAVIMNGRGLLLNGARMLSTYRGKLAELAPETIAALDRLLPAEWQGPNPCNVGMFDPERDLPAALAAILRDPDVGAVLMIHAPSATQDAAAVARAVAAVAVPPDIGRFACWFGGAHMTEAAAPLQSAGWPVFDTPEMAVGAYLYAIAHQRSQMLLAETVPSIPQNTTPDRTTANAIIDAAIAQGRRLLRPDAALALIAAYGISVVETRIAETPEEVAIQASLIDGPVAVKILAPEVPHKSELLGVALDLHTGEQAASAARLIKARIRGIAPGAKIEGFLVQKMIADPVRHELVIGMAQDPTFGPVMVFGAGGAATTIRRDAAIGFPPLNMKLAKDIAKRTQIDKLLRGYRSNPPADQRAVRRALVRLSRLVIDEPRIAEIEVNPLIALTEGVLAVDALVRLNPDADTADPYRRLAIRPYPAELEERAETRQGDPILLRPVRPEDMSDHADMLADISPEDIRLRFFENLKEVPRHRVARLTTIDYDREMAFVARALTPKGEETKTLGVARAHFDPDRMYAEFATLVRSDLKRTGLGRLLMDKLTAYCRDQGALSLWGEVLNENAGMLGLARKMGFCVMSAEPGSSFIALPLSGDVPKNKRLLLPPTRR